MKHGKEKPEEQAAEQTPEENEPSGMREVVSELLELVETILVSVFVVMLLFTYVVCIAVVEGDSMVPTLMDGDRLVFQRMSRDYSTGDILIIDSETAYTFDEAGELKENQGLGKRIVKRLIAKGGQEVDIDFSKGEVSVDGKVLDEPYTDALTTRDEGAFESYPITVPQGYVFVLGDNRSVSKDSRHPQVALIPEKEIMGQVIFRISPLSDFGAVK